MEVLDKGRILPLARLSFQLSKSFHGILIPHLENFGQLSGRFGALCAIGLKTDVERELGAGALHLSAI